MLRVLIHGAGGRMGRVLLEAIRARDDMRAVAGVDKMGAGGLGLPVYESLEDVSEPCDVLIDFSRPDALGEILSFCAARGVAAVLATTGYTKADVARIERAAMRTPIFRSANMSLGVNLLMELAKQSTAFLGGDCDAEIIETHHRTKADSPSGTALMLAEALNAACEEAKEYRFGRHALSEQRSKSEIGIHSVRGGTVVGDHTVMFLMDDERVELSHSAQSRAIFARGAIAAALFVAGNAPKLYDMRDLLLAKAAVTHVKAERGVALVTVEGLSEASDSIASVLSRLARAGIVLDMISSARGTEGLSLAISLSAADAPAAEAALSEMKPAIVAPLNKLTVSGLGMERQAGVASRVFALTARLGVLPRLVSTSPTEISLLVDPDDEFVVADAIGKEFGIA